MKKEIKNFYEQEYHYEEDFKHGIHKKRLNKFLDPLELNGKGKFLDIGCGVGHALFYGLDNKVDVFGLDLSYKALKFAEKVTEGKTGLICGDGQRLPFSDKSFDYVSALGVIEHFPSTEQGIEEIYRILKPGGKALIVVPNSYGILNKMGLYNGTEQEQELLLTHSEWTKLIEKSGLKRVKTLRDIGPPVFKNYKPHKIIQRMILKLTLIMPISAAYEFIFLCEK